MKNFILLFIILVLGLVKIHAQTIYFSYDDGGNRIYRGTISISGVRMTNKQVKDSIVVDHMEIKLYPNPTEDILQMDVRGLDANAKLMYYLYDVKGDLVAKASIYPSNQIKMSGFPNGIYILKLPLSDKKSEEWKVSKR